LAEAGKAEQRKDRRIVVENVRRMLLKEYLMRETQRAGFGGLDIQRTPMGTRVTLIAERPGLVIGRKGGAIKALTEAVERQFSFDNPQIEVQEVSNPSLNAQIMAEKLANALERGWHFRRAGHSTVRRIMEAGAKGCLVVVAGKLTGQRHRRQKFKAGHIKYCGEPRNTWMRKGFAIARLKPGVIGVTVSIMDPDAKLPDDIIVRPPTAAEIAAREAAVAAGPEAVVEEGAPVEAGAEGEGEAGEAAAELELPVDDSPVAPDSAVAEELPEKVKTSKIAEKKLKKVLKEVKALGVEVDVDVEVKKEKKEKK
jgi:small subunit ribosomal protein S3